MKADPAPRNCECCGKYFHPTYKRTKARFCSKSCIWKATKGAEYNAVIARESASKRGDIQRGRGDKTYVKQGGRHQHRIVAETILGRPLANKEIVHHKDGNKKNNDPNNLEIITQGEHMRRHGIGIPGVTPWWKPWESRGKK